MSLQLIIYPQSYNGLNPLSGAGTQVLVDGIDFTSINTSSSTQSVSGTILAVPQNYINSFGTFIVNTWYRFSGEATDAFASGTTLVFLLEDGVAQRLSNLVVGATYNVNITMGALNAGGFMMKHFSGTTEIASYLFSTGSGTNSTSTVPIIPVTSTDIVVFYSLGATFIESLSVVQTATGVTVTNLNTGQAICDLYEDEEIPLTLSVDEFKNAAEQVKSYSKAFMLPATKRNNKIFDNLFEITRGDDGVVFNPYVKTQCVLKQDGFVLFEGYLRIIDIQDKEGEISYNVNLYSEVIALADILEEKTFSDLDFTELEHLYNKTNIKLSWNDYPSAGLPFTNPSTSGFRDANSTIKYPFVNWANNIAIAAAGGTPTANMPEMFQLEQAFRPFINIKYLIDRIFNQDNFPFTYESNFFDTTDFNKLYMDFNWGSSRYTLQTGGVGEFVTGSPSIQSTTSWQPYVLNDYANFTADLNYNSTNHQFVALQDNTQYTISPVISFSNYPTPIVPTGDLYVRIAHKDAGGALIQEYQLQTFSLSNYSSCTYYVLNQSVILQQNETLGVEWKSDTAAEYEQFRNGGNVILAQTGGGMVTTATYLQNLRGELGQWEFLKGIFTMFNIVTVPDTSNPNHILIEPYKDMFLENPDSSELNWSDKVDIAEIKLTPLTDLKQNTIFKFVEDDDDFPFQNYKQQVGGHLYGSQFFDAETSSSGLKTILQGEEEIIAEPFAATVPKPLMAQYSELIVPAIYSYNAEDDTSEGFDNSPRIMYNNGIVSMTSGDSYYIPEQNGVAGENTEDFLQFSHLSEIPTTSSSVDFHFGACQLIPPIGNATTNNLFMTYWLPYYNELYNPDTRMMTLKVDLRSGDMNTFKFYDIITIKNRKFRVNKIEYKPNDLSTVEFILIP